MHGTVRDSFGDMLLTVALGIAVISANVALRSQYCTTRPTSAGLALF